MASYNTNEFRSGLKIILDSDPFVIVENEFVKPGKGQAFNRVKVRNLKTGRVVDRTFKSGDSVEAADVIEQNMQYLYADGEFWHFMLPDTFEQFAADKSAVGDAEQWLKEQDTCLFRDRDEYIPVASRAPVPGRERPGTGPSGTDRDDLGVCL